jgi:hypothetical protein
MQSTFIKKEIVYDGTQLQPHWIFKNAGLAGDCIASFIGGADVPVSHMVDLVDVANDEPIFSKSMLHLLVEHFDSSLELAIARQRLLVAIAADALRKALPREDVKRDGDDIFIRGRKLSVSIATASPVSTLIHFAMNIISDGTPVPTVGLSDLGIEPVALSANIMDSYKSEIDSMRMARTKVRPVFE